MVQTNDRALAELHPGDPEFAQYQYPLTAVGPDCLYDYYKDGSKSRPIVRPYPEEAV